MRLQTIAVLWVLLVAPVFAISQQKPASKSTAVTSGTAKTSTEAKLPTEDQINIFLKQQVGWMPQATWKITSIKPSKAEGLAEVSVLISEPQGQGTQTIFVTADGKHAVLGDIVPFPRPFDEARQSLAKKANGPSRGPADSPVTIVEFSDLQCPHCKEAAPTIEKLLSEEPNVHFVFQSFPLPMHNWAQKGAAYADCVAKFSNEAFWKFISSVYEAQSDITAENAEQKLTELADKAGVKGADVAACSTQAGTQTHIEASVNLGKSLDVNSTPTLFINGRPVGVSGNNYEVLKQLVDFAASQK